jgi:hypothetical protein
LLVFLKYEHLLFFEGSYNSYFFNKILTHYLKIVCEEFVKGVWEKEVGFCLVVLVLELRYNQIKKY